MCPLGDLKVSAVCYRLSAINALKYKISGPSAYLALQRLYEDILGVQYIYRDPFVLELVYRDSLTSGYSLSLQLHY